MFPDDMAQPTADELASPIGKPSKLPRGYNERWLRKARQAAREQYAEQTDGKKLRREVVVRRRSKIRPYGHEPKVPKRGRNIVIFTAAMPVDWRGTVLGYDQLICYRAYVRGEEVYREDVPVRKYSRADFHRTQWWSRHLGKRAFKEAVLAALLHQ